MHRGRHTRSAPPVAVDVDGHGPVSLPRGSGRTGKIFGIGLSRTGTRSLHHAVEILGLRSLHHGDDGIATYEAVERAAWERRPLLFYVGEDYDAYSDIGSLSERFDLADRDYPGSRFILTVRDLDAWVDSWRRKVAANAERSTRAEYAGANVSFDLDREIDRRHRHHARVREYFRDRPRDLLEIDICAGQGWDLLAPFLGVECPDVAFPHLNEQGPDLVMGPPAHLDLVTAGPPRRAPGASKPWRRPRPPATPAGWLSGPPDFVGVGVQEACTDWWLQNIAVHPAVFVGSTPDLHFFDDGWSRAFDEDDVVAYHQWFPRLPGMMTGEWTPRYMLDPWTPGRLRRAAPEARLLVMLRDPVERFRSGIARRYDRHGSLPAEAVIEAEERGRYAAQLGRLCRSFPRDRVLVLQLEQCLVDPRRQLQRTYRFLGLDDNVVPETFEMPLPPNRTPEMPETPEMPVPDDLLVELREGYRPDVEQLITEWPGAVDLSLWPNFARPQ